jgi:hypothetical protein
MAMSDSAYARVVEELKRQRTRPREHVNNRLLAESDRILIDSSLVIYDDDIYRAGLPKHVETTLRARVRHLRARVKALPLIRRTSTVDAINAAARGVPRTQVALEAATRRLEELIEGAGR